MSNTFRLTPTMNRGSLRVKAVRDKLLTAMMQARKTAKHCTVLNRKGDVWLKVQYCLHTHRWFIRCTAGGYFFIDCKDAQNQCLFPHMGFGKPSPISYMHDEKVDCVLITKGTVVMPTGTFKAHYEWPKNILIHRGNVKSGRIYN